MKRKKISVIKMNTCCDLFEWALSELYRGNLDKALKLKNISDKYR